LLYFEICQSCPVLIKRLCNSCCCFIFLIFCTRCNDLFNVHGSSSSSYTFPSFSLAIVSSYSCLISSIQSGNIPKGEANSRMICTKFLKSDWFTPTFFPAFFVDFRDYYLQLKPRKHIRKRRLLFIFSSN